MKNMKKILAWVLVLVFALSLVACGSNAKPAESAKSDSTAQVAKEEPKKEEPKKEEKQKQIVLTVMTQQHAYFQGIIKRWQSLAVENNFKLTVMDPNFDNTKAQKIVEDIIALKPDGVAFAPLESKMGVQMVKQIMDAGIKVVPYNIAPSELLGPTVVGGNYQGGVTAGENAARIWKEKHADVKPVVGIISVVGIKEVDDRVNGFLEGFNKTYPDVKPVQTVNGEGKRDKSLKVCEDMLQAHPDINIVYGINDDSGLGALDALKEVKKNTIDKALVAAIDGSEAALIEVKKPESALKVDVGNPTKEMAEITWDALKKVMNENYNEKKAIPVPFQYIAPEKADEWLAAQFPK